ncbi:glycosyltransferase [Streptomyces zingiberis]|uniref:Glycosyltransferase family 1 protein n=1 Tax=Streptomyces zingiberis TaxID=2053010 RepID=A0ABX1BX81_9ACTN|nr:glycosyltransferase [Streptomyces zingiberis]NJQ01033.1 glycosyltransferase family 1 protein [Streptomyces zingiberis]
MRALLSTTGTRGEVQPLVALALRLRELGQEAVICAPPDFQEWGEALGIPWVPAGPELRGTATPAAAVPPPPGLRQRMIHGMVADQFEAVGAAAEGCDVIVGGGPMALAARSVAERRGVRYVHVAFAPVTLPSPHHAPPPMFDLPEEEPADGAAGNRDLWSRDARRWNRLFGAALNAQRSALGLAPVDDVSRHLVSGSPWLAADPVLAPWPGPSVPEVFQTGAWTLVDDRPLPPEVERFLDAGDPPVHFGFGSVRAPVGIADTMIAAARAVGRRAILARGWAGLSLGGAAPGCLEIGEVNQQALFRRVAAVVHHGGAGTTTTAAAAGVPQVVLPQLFDQFYFAGRVTALGAGGALPAGRPAAGSLTAALRDALGPRTVAEARDLADRIRTDGAPAAARRLAGGW